MNKNGAFSYAVRFAFASLLCVLIILGLGYAFTSHTSKQNSSTSLPVFNESNKIRFVIDPGHGGEDAGAVATDGTLEKDLNLDIATLLYTILDLNGNDVVLTRDEDTLLYDRFGDLKDYTGQKKVYDLKNRLRIAEEKENSIYVGIHMNKFSQEKYSGLQVYFSANNPLSYQIATSIKSTVKSCLQPQNNREIKRATSSIFILNRAQIPSVLVECGFLSNKAELAALKNVEYQRSLALSLFASLVSYGN